MPAIIAHNYPATAEMVVCAIDPGYDEGTAVIVFVRGGTQQTYEIFPPDPAAEPVQRFFGLAPKVLQATPPQRMETSQQRASLARRLPDHWPKALSAWRASRD